MRQGGGGLGPNFENFLSFLYLKFQYLPILELFTELKKLALLQSYVFSKLACFRVRREMYGKSHS